MKFFAKCQVCNKKRFITKKREIVLPSGQIALSQKNMCTKCIGDIKKMLKSTQLNTKEQS